MTSPQTNDEISKFSVRIFGEPVDAPEGQRVLIFDCLSRMCKGWEDTEYDEDTDTGEDLDAEEQGEEELLVATGCIDLLVGINAASIDEYAKYDPDEFESLSIVITYLDAAGNPVFQHVYSCDPGLVLIQTSGTQEEPPYITASVDYYDVERFILPDTELTEQTH